MDGAQYHRSRSAMDFFKDLGLNIVILGPYSYDGAPIERLFAFIKRKPLNVSLTSTGKK